MSALRPVTLIAGGAIAVHELSYLAGFGTAGSHAPADHSYVAALLPALAILAALALFATVERGVAGTRTPPASALTRALTYAAAIVAVFFGQEAVEGLLAGAGPVQIASVLAARGVMAIPLALALGFIASLAMHGLETVEARIATRFDQSTPRRAPRLGLRPRWLDVVLSPTLLAGSAAPRAPPSPA
jgi:hypothetical protein